MTVNAASTIPQAVALDLHTELGTSDLNFSPYLSQFCVRLQNSLKTRNTEKSWLQLLVRG
ncbi:MAG: hypothetical protein KME64_00320 [Scytonematopsis contorta HA4267-MV1]|nr:hypothetical protein [Scytonematopsis contorta HA4267-MV1]